MFVSQVTEQFLDYMKGLSFLDVDKVSEYLKIAATIIKIKAQSLVPNIEEDPDLEAEIEEDKAEIICALEEFRLIKEETKKLKELETIGYFFKETDKNVGEVKTVFSLENLTSLCFRKECVACRHLRKASGEPQGDQTYAWGTEGIIRRGRRNPASRIQRQGAACL